jgi:hypothetical protein
MLRPPGVTEDCSAARVGAGAVIWVFISEIFPARERSMGQTLGSATHWTCAALLTLLFPRMVETLSPATIFSFFCGMTCLHMVWVLTLVPETRGVALEDMGAVLARGGGTLIACGGQGAGGGSAGAEKRAGELQGLVGGAESDSET